MKLDEVARERLRIRLEEGRAGSNLTISEISKRAGVDQGQASRICRGDIRTLSHNVMRICNVLNVDVEAALHGTEEAEIRRRLAEQAMRLWDRTPEGVDRVLRLLRLLEELRTH